MLKEHLSLKVELGIGVPSNSEVVLRLKRLCLRRATSSLPQDDTEFSCGIIRSLQCKLGEFIFVMESVDDSES